MSAPQGWDEQPDEQTIVGAREVRKTFLALQAVGFTMTEAATIVAGIIAAREQAQARSQSPG